MSSHGQAAFLAPPAALLDMQCVQTALRGASSQTSSGSGLSSGTQAVDQPASWLGSSHALQPHADHSYNKACAAAGPAGAQQHAAAARWAQQRGQQQHWHFGVLGSPGSPVTLDAQAATEHSWQLGGSISSGIPSPTPQQRGAAAVVMPAVEPDPWSLGLELMAAEGPGAGSEPPLPITDASLDALLAPFEEFPFLLQPLPAAPLLDSLAEQPAGPAAALAPAPAGMAGAAAAAAAPRTGGSSAGAQPSGAAACSDAAGQPARRKGGRPRVHHPRTSAAAAAPAAKPSRPPAAKGGSGGSLPAPAPATQPLKKTGRGPKPKYVFGTAEEAADARRERNRRAALDSYYRKKQYTEVLQQEIAGLMAENAALQQLLGEMSSSGLCPLLEASDDGINMWLQQHTAAAAPAPADATGTGPDAAGSWQ